MLDDLERLNAFARRRKDIPTLVRGKNFNASDENVLRRLLETIQGPPGRDGKPGKSGFNGKQGSQGERGPDGTPGKVGPTGSQGKQGPPGRDGADGADGPPGPQGPPGRDGVTQIAQIAASAGTAFPRNNFGALIDPTVTNDMRNGGYRAGSKWVNVITDEEFVCTDPAPGAAIWKSTTSAAVDIAAHEAAANPHPTYLTDAEHSAIGDTAPHHAAVTIGADVEHSLVGQVLSGVDASATQKGHVELATTAETTTGTDTGRVPPVSALPVQVQDSHWTYAADAEASDTYVITLAPAIAAYTAGQVFHFKANTANTGAASLNVNAKGAVTIKKHRDQDLATGDIEANQIVTVVYDGTNFQMQSQTAQTPVLDGDFGATEGFLRKTAAGAYTAHKSNLAAGAVPTVNDDSGDGYSIGSEWIYGSRIWIAAAVTVGAANWREISPKLPYIHVTTRVYAPPGELLAGSTLIDLLKAAPMYIPDLHTYTQITAEVTAAAGAGAIRLGIYADNGAMYPGALILDAGTIDSNSVAIQSIAISQSLPCGWVWLAMVPNISVSMRLLAPTSHVSSAVLGYASAAASSTTVGGVSVAFTYAALPNPFTAGATLVSTVPRLALTA